MPKLTYNGPAGQVNYEVGIETGSPELEPGAVYDVSAKLAKRVLESSAWFSKAAKSEAATDNEA